MLNAADSYYTNDSWDVSSWIDVIAVEYETLVETFPFNADLAPQKENKPFKLLDVGCGTAIFPSYLDEALPHNIRFVCDLLDVSQPSLQQATRVLSGLDHFEVNRTYETRIEDIPTALKNHEHHYDVIWAIHSFTTVDIQSMAKVFAHLSDMLAPGGYLYVYQLTAASSYQKFHSFYLAYHENGKRRNSFMEYEDTTRILDARGFKYDVHELAFEHVIEFSRPDLLERYLQKCILDSSVDVLQFFNPILEHFRDEATKSYRIPQHVNFVVLRKQSNTDAQIRATHISAPRRGSTSSQELESLTILTGEYYSDCHVIFRRATNQSNLMLREAERYCRGKENLRILSVGSGVGLFEIPMLESLATAGIHVDDFVGIDIDQHSCATLRPRLSEEFGGQLAFEVLQQPFQDFTTEARFDVVIFNHVFEYLEDRHVQWIRKSLNLLSERGNILIFSPHRGGLNKFYARHMQELNGFEPFFSDDIAHMLRRHSIKYSAQPIDGKCDITLLMESKDQPDRDRLLSFLTQIDSRALSDERKNNFIDYYESLRAEGTTTIAHPATLFIL